MSGVPENRVDVYALLRNCAQRRGENITNTVDTESSLLFPESELPDDAAGNVPDTMLMNSYMRLLGGLLFDERVRFEEESGARSGCTDE